ncbi:bifunctional nuclease family protein [Haloglomus halophilum]|uniref:bifunctional nuclease family protein n=1 Tax=Haloglomus halophilum TaxID=2962672 RepID=UPI0020CA162A|nr:bifunctional nuclease family protein [Haloglomus halophilum]
MNTDVSGDGEDTDADADVTEGLPARIDSVRVAGTPNGPVPVVLLAVEEDGTAAGDAREDGVDSAGGPEGPLEGEVLPIFIGFEEARSIVRGMEAEDIGRPMTHDLTLDIVEELGGRVDRVAVSNLEEGTFFATLWLNTPRDDVTVDARPSDSLALAARTNAPLLVARPVWEGAAEDADRFAELDNIREVFEDEE